MKGFLHVDTFKKKYGITQEQLNELERQMHVEIVQTGFKGHSLMHPRAVVFNPEEIKRLVDEDYFPEPDWRYRCLGGPESNPCLMGFQTKNELLLHREQAHNSYGNWETSSIGKEGIRHMKKIRKQNDSRRI